jgi:hypothetical protein
MATNITAKTVLTNQSGTTPEIVTRDSAEIIADEKRGKASAVAATPVPDETSMTPEINVTIDVTPLAEQQKASMEQILAIQQQVLDRVMSWPGQSSFPPDLESEQGEKTRSTVYIAPLSTRRAGLSPDDALKEYNHVFDHTQKASFDAGSGIGMTEAIDHRPIDLFVRQNRASLQQAMQEEGHKHGLFRAAATVMTDIPASFSGYLSSIMRETPKWGKVWWQFLSPVIQLGVQSGNRIDVPRAGFLTRPTSSGAWDHPVGQPFAPTSQALTNGYEKVEVTRYAMGKVGASNDPVSVDEFYFRHSILDLESRVQMVLGNNLAEFRELITYENYYATPIVRFFKKSTKAIVSVATSLAGADDALLSYESIVRLRAHMNGDLGVIPWADGCYVMVCHPNAVTDLELELTAMGKPVSRMDIEQVTNMIKMVNTSIEDKISGYRFTVGGFHIFTHENIPPDPLFMRIVDNARNFYTNIAFGPGAVCEAISMAPEIRNDEMKQFGTTNRFIWLSYGKYQAIERGPDTTNTTGSISQRSQVVQFRTGA